MGKAPAAIAKLPNLLSNLISQSKQAKPTSRLSIFVEEEEKLRSKKKAKKLMETSSSDVDGAASRSNNAGGGSSSGSRLRVPLSEVVSDCVKRWFQDTLKEAEGGDINMQVLVSQMYYTGYGVSRDARKGKAWMTRAARTRSSVWKVSDKRPGYNASDSDSDDELNGDS